MIAHLRHPIAEPFMGGMEAHSMLLVRTLLAQGHDVTLFASGDSDASVPLQAVSATAYEAEYPWALWHGRHELRHWLQRAYGTAWDAIAAGGFDIVHNNSLFPDLHDWAARDGVPMVTSLHVPPFAMLRDAIARNDRPWLRLTVTSASQMPAWSGVAEGRIAVAYNGIDLDRFAFSPVGGDTPLWCGRITPNKGTLEALQAAHAADVPLDIAGPIDCSDYFALVEPLLGSRHRYLGHLPAAVLAARMARAAYLVCTPCWDEPFGLVAAEAMACGTPVVALDRGALREVVGEAGAIAADEADLAAIMRQGIAVPRATCRARAERLFGAGAMVERYAESYAAAMAGAGSPLSASSIAMTSAVLA